MSQSRKRKKEYTFEEDTQIVAQTVVNVVISTREDVDPVPFVAALLEGYAQRVRTLYAGEVMGQATPLASPQSERKTNGGLGREALMRSFNRLQRRKYTFLEDMAVTAQTIVNVFFSIREDVDPVPFVAALLEGYAQRVRTLYQDDPQTRPAQPSLSKARSKEHG